VDTIPEPLNALLDKEVKTVSVYVVKKDILPCVPTQDDMITCTGIMDSRFTSHAYIIPSSCKVAILTP
jgi:hypothetical protein